MWIAGEQFVAADAGERDADPGPSRLRDEEGVRAVEARLIEHPAVVEAAVVAAQVEGFTKAKAFVVCAADAPHGRLADELRSFCAERLHRYQVPQLFEFVDGLPKTVTGKIQRYKLRGP